MNYFIKNEISILLLAIIFNSFSQNQNSNVLNIYFPSGFPDGNKNDIVQLLSKATGKPIKIINA